MTVAACQLPPETVHRICHTIAQGKPAYSALLPFFESVFTIQEAAVSTADPDPIRIADKVLAAKRKGGLPLLERSKMPVDWTAALKLLDMLCEAAGRANPYLAEAGGILAKHLHLPANVLEDGFLALLADDSRGLEQSAVQLGVSAHMLPFFLYNSLWPSIAVHARRLEDNLENHEAGTDGYCPLCGGTPFISLLGAGGQRVLVCSFCRHQWPVTRIFCPFCGSTDSAAISYFFSGQEEEYRVHTCRSCRGYIKTVDTRQLQRICYPPLEAVVSVHLDIKAQSLGFASRVPPWLGL